MDTPDSTTLKRCSKCGELKQRTEFGVQKSHKDGLRSWCSVCRREEDRRWRAENPEKARERSRRCREADPDRDRRYYKAHLDKARENRRRYRAEHIDQERERVRRWYANNPDRARDNRRRWKIENADKMAGYDSRWRAEHPDKARAYHHNRRARKKNNGGTHTASDLAAIRTAQTDKQDRLVCWACGKPIVDEPELDHWIPLKHGGRNDAGNLHYMHAHCNQLKHAKHPTELGRLL